MGRADGSGRAHNFDTVLAARTIDQCIPPMVCRDDGRGGADGVRTAARLRPVGSETSSGDRRPGKRSSTCARGWPHDRGMEVHASKALGDFDLEASQVALLEQLEHAFQLRHRNPEEGERIGSAILDIAQARGLAHVEAVSAVVLAYCADISDAPDDGLARLEEAVEICGKVGDQKNLVRAADLIATIFEGTGDYLRALRYAETAFEGARALGDRLFEACALSSLSGIFTATGDLELAEKKARFALKIATEIGSRRMQARLHLRLGRIQRRAGNRDHAGTLLEQTRSIGREVGSVFLQAEALTELGRLYEEQERFADAESALLEALRISDVDTEQIVTPSTKVALGRVYLRTGRPKRARETLSSFGKRATFFDMVPILAEGSRLLAETHDALGEPELALEQYRRHVKYREQAMQGEAHRAVNRYQVKLQLAAAEREAEHQRERYRELEAVQTQLVEAERRAAVGNLAAGLAHEMNTPLGVARSSLDTLGRARQRVADELPSDAVSGRVQAALSAMQSAQTTSVEALRRLEELVLSLRRFTRLDEAEVQNVNLNECVDAAFSLLPPTLCKGILVERLLAPLPRIRGWPGKINQALLTLLVNAAEVQQSRGRIRVESMTRGDACLVRVIDDGPGIPEAARDKLFEITFDVSGGRTRFRVGLATVRAAMADHGGTIDFETGPSGTTFTLVFPR